jgi:hypothetical protein
LLQLLEFSLKLNGSISEVKGMPTFYKYFSIDNANQTSLPKFIMYISHDEILGAFFKALGSKVIQGALPAADIYVEFYKPGTTLSEQRFLQEEASQDIMVRVFYNETVS